MESDKTPGRFEACHCAAGGCTRACSHEHGRGGPGMVAAPTCDCVSYCGDDQRIKAGAVTPCADLIRQRRYDIAFEIAFAAVRERVRQVTAERYTPEHDDTHAAGELALAAALYALPYESHLVSQAEVMPLQAALELAAGWTVKPEPDQRKRLIRAIALLLAEIERLDRAAAAGAAV